MPLYHYRAINSDGAVVKGMVDATDMDAVYGGAWTSDLHVISVRQTNAHLVRLYKRIRARHVSRRDIIEFSVNLAAMIGAGIPLLSALADIAETTENKYFRGKIESIRSNVVMGTSFATAVKMHADVFPDIFIRVTSVGEETGGLEDSLRDTANHLQRMEDLASAIKRAMVYPVFALVTATGALLFWLVYVLPKVLAIFRDMSVSVPLITRALILISDFAQKYWPLILAFPVLLFITVRILKLYRRPAYYIDLAKLKTPVLKHILTNKILGLFTEQMNIMIRAGLTIDRAFELAREVIGNRVYQDAVSRATAEVLAGAGISEAMSNQRIFPPMLLRMLHVGEISGTLEEQFAFLSEFHLKRLDDISQRLGKMLEPIIISVLGVIFAIIIIGLLLPVYDLVSKIGRM